MNEALEYIKSKHNGEIPYKYGANECAKLMAAYAKEYHKHQLKILNIPDVINYTELEPEFRQALDDLCKKFNKPTKKRF